MGHVKVSNDKLFRDKVEKARKIKADFEDFCKMEDELNSGNPAFLDSTCKNESQLNISDEGEDSDTESSSDDDDELKIGDNLNLSRFDHLSDESFNPKETDTSSRFDAGEKKEMLEECYKSAEEKLVFPRLDLKQLPKKFTATVLSIHGYRTLNIKPITRDNREFTLLEQQLLRLSQIPIGPKTQLKKVKEQSVCLALSEKHQKLVRGIIETVDDSSETAKVFCVDLATEEVLPFKNLCECPKELIRYPLNWIQVELTEVRATKGMRASEVKQKLMEEIAKRYVFCVVTRINTADPTDPVGVEIYEDEKCQTLIYEKLLKQKIYIRNRY